MPTLNSFHTFVIEHYNDTLPYHIVNGQAIIPKAKQIPPNVYTPDSTVQKV